MSNNKEYQREVKRVKREIWSLVSIGGCYVIDVGVGESTKELAKRAALVVGLDIDEEKIRRINRSNSFIELVVADILSVPLRSRCADLIVFHFTLHEINPELHEKVLRIAKEIADKVMIVEGDPKGCPTYVKFSKLWSEAMHSIGKYEDMKPPEYWLRSVRRVGMEIRAVKIIKWRTNVPYTVFKDIVKETIKEWRRLGVNEKYIAKLNDLLEEVKREGFRWSDIVAILAEVKKFRGSDVVISDTISFRITCDFIESLVRSNAH